MADKFECEKERNKREKSVEQQKHSAETEQGSKTRLLSTPAEL